MLPHHSITLYVASMKKRLSVLPSLWQEIWSKTYSIAVASPSFLQLNSIIHNERRIDPADPAIP